MTLLCGRWRHPRVGYLSRYADDESVPEQTGAALSDDGSIEAVTHNEHPWLAVMWHPERAAPFEQDDRDLAADIFIHPVLPETFRHSQMTN